VECFARRRLWAGVRFGFGPYVLAGYLSFLRQKRKFIPGPIRAHRAPTGIFFSFFPRFPQRRSPAGRCDNPPDRHRRQCSSQIPALRSNLVRQVTSNRRFLPPGAISPDHRFVASSLYQLCGHHLSVDKTVCRHLELGFSRSIRMYSERSQLTLISN